MMIVVIATTQQRAQIVAMHQADRQQRRIKRSCAWCRPPKHGRNISDIMCNRCHDRLLAEWRAQHAEI